MEYRRFENTVMLRLDPGEEILTKLAELAEKEQIILAEVTGLGALNELEICVYDIETKQYYTNTYAEALELLSLSGTITRMNEKPYLHIHACAGDGTGKAVGGHLRKAVISVTGEIVIRMIEGQVGRKLNESIGMNLLAF